jgi:hypothetical protein
MHWLALFYIPAQRPSIKAAPAAGLFSTTINSASYTSSEMRDTAGLFPVLNPFDVAAGVFLYRLCYVLEGKKKAWKL